jgi:membrane protein required for colicin V production
MNTFDIVAGIILGVAIIKGLKNGLVMELAALVGLLLGIFGAIFFSDVAESYLRQFIDFKYLKPVAFLLTFTAIVLGVHLIAKMINKVVEVAMLSIPNRLAGALFSFLKTALILSVLLVVIDYTGLHQSIFPERIKEQSKLYVPVRDFAPLVIPGLDFDRAESEPQPEAPSQITV